MMKDCSSETPTAPKLEAERRKVHTYAIETGNSTIGIEGSQSRGERGTISVLVVDLCNDDGHELI